MCTAANGPVPWWRVYEEQANAVLSSLSKLNIDEGPSGAAAILAKFVDFEDRYDADKNVTDDEVRTATAEAKALLEGKAP